MIERESLGCQHHRRLWQLLLQPHIDRKSSGLTRHYTTINLILHTELSLHQLTLSTPLNQNRSQPSAEERSKSLMPLLTASESQQTIVLWEYRRKNSAISMIIKGLYRILSETLVCLWFHSRCMAALPRHIIRCIMA
jgi:hypothetical protein